MGRMFIWYVRWLDSVISMGSFKNDNTSPIMVCVASVSLHTYMYVPMYRSVICQCMNEAFGHSACCSVTVWMMWRMLKTKMKCILYGSYFLWLAVSVIFQQQKHISFSVGNSENMLRSQKGFSRFSCLPFYIKLTKKISRLDKFLKHFW